MGNMIEFIAAGKAPRLASAIAALEALLDDGRDHNRTVCLLAMTTTGLAESTARSLLAETVASGRVRVASTRRWRGRDWPASYRTAKR